MSCLRSSIGLSLAAISLLAGCGRTDAIIDAQSVGDEIGETWSYETTASGTNDTIADIDTGTWDTTPLDTWGETEPDWGEDWEDTTDWTETSSTETTGSETETETSSTSSTSSETTETETSSTETTSSETETETETSSTSTETSSTETTSSETETETSSTSTETTETETTTSTETTETTTTTSTTTGGGTCADGTACLVECGDFGQTCIDECTADLPDDEASALFDLQICAIQACFFLGQCTLGDFNAPECVQCRFDANQDPASFGCADEGAVCGL
ncbi:hypothetical protein G6O69_29625 [Pseudenhygromyxa sp. WMMC2535]|uniref:hypothetical protein n=1 Tax=Pseudenhygromyxa sp. WMMC2535 TaxID=2712867 RepID=UPI001556933D|nr:hypothetical protein [Pseudenhygromyxa sp. WMMC2535]NVB42023.1 hypothetical protein [Pseudenhygromyxa sp. WMMC2535]